MPIDYDDYLDVLFLYWVKDTTACEHDDLFYISVVSQLLKIYVYVCLCWAWTMKHMIDEMFFVDKGALEHMGN